MNRLWSAASIIIATLVFLPAMSFAQAVVQYSPQQRIIYVQPSGVFPESYRQHGHAVSVYSTLKRPLVHAGFPGRPPHGYWKAKRRGYGYQNWQSNRSPYYGRKPTHKHPSHCSYERR